MRVVIAEDHALLRDGLTRLLEANDCTVPESSIIIEYLDRYYPGPTRFIPGEPDLAWQTRLSERFYDLYVHLSVQKMVDDRLRPEAQKDPRGVEEARARIKLCYGMTPLQYVRATRT